MSSEAPGLAQAPEPKAPGLRYPSYPLPEGRGFGGLTPHNPVTLPLSVCEPLTYPALRTDATGETFQKFAIPGVGEITDSERCGIWTSVAACSRNPKEYRKPIKHSCDDPSCPICFGRWAAKQAARNADTLRGYIQAANRGQATLEGNEAAAWHRDNSRYLNHYVLSAKLSDVTPDMDIDAIKARGRWMQRRVGITGGIMYFHAWRIPDPIKKRLSYHCREAARMNEDDREKKFWELVRADILGLGSWRKYVVWGPHFHIIGFGRLPSQRTPEEKAAARVVLAGWTAIWIRHVETEVEKLPNETRDQIAELAAYLLSHSAYFPGKKIPARIGVCTPDRLKKVGKPVNENYEALCPKCGAPIIWGGEDADGNFIPQVNQDGAWIPYLVKSHWQKYEIVKGQPP